MTCLRTGREPGSGWLGRATRAATVGGVKEWKGDTETNTGTNIGVGRAGLVPIRSAGCVTAACVGLAWHTTTR